MLILGRRPGESIMIGDDIKITLLSINGNQVRIGLDVDKDITILREELYIKEQDEKEGLRNG